MLSPHSSSGFNKYDVCRPWIYETLHQSTQNNVHQDSWLRVAQIIGIRWISNSETLTNGHTVSHLDRPLHPVHHSHGANDRRAAKLKRKQSVSTDAQIVGLTVADGMHSIDCNLIHPVPYRGPFAIDKMVNLTKFAVKTDLVQKNLVFLVVSECSIYSVLPELPSVYGAYCKDINTEYGIHDVMEGQRQSQCTDSMLIGIASNNMTAATLSNGDSVSVPVAIKQESFDTVYPPMMEEQSTPNTNTNRNLNAISSSKRRWDAMSMNGNQVKMEREIKRQRVDDSLSVNFPFCSSSTSSLESTVPPQAMQCQMMFMGFDDIGKREKDSNVVYQDKGVVQQESTLGLVH